MSLESEVVEIEKELKPILDLGEKYASSIFMQKTKFTTLSDGTSEALLTFPFTKRERIKFLFPYIFVRALGLFPAVLEVIDESNNIPVTLLRREFYPQAELLPTTYFWSMIHAIDDRNYGALVQNQKYKFRFTPGKASSSVGIVVDFLRLYDADNPSLFDIYGVVF